MKRKREKPKKRDKKKKSLWRIWIVDTFVPAAAMALFVITFIGQLYKIPTASMKPTLQVGDRILVCKFIYGLRIPFSGKWLFQQRPPRRGDVLVFLYDKEHLEERKFITRVTDFLSRKKPWSNRKNYIKRLVTVGGETLEIKDEKVYINGEPIAPSPAFPEERKYYNRREESWPGANGNQFPMFYRSEEIKVPEGYLFVLGDNSLSSKDSRCWGFVSLRKVRGKAICIVWPPRRIGLIY